MKISSAIRPCALLAVLLGLASARAQAPAADQVSEFTVGGLKVIVKQRPSTQTVSTGVFFQGGRASLTAGNAGIERLLLDAATEGSANFPRDRLQAELARLAADLSIGTNQDYSVISLQCTREGFDQAFAILADAVMHPALAEAEVERIRTRMIATAGMADADPSDQLQHLLEAGIYAGQTYANREQGTPQSLAAIRREDVQAYHRNLLQAARMRLVVVGNVDPADIRRKVKAVFAGLPPGDSSEGNVPTFHFAAPSFQRIPRDVPATYVVGAFAAPAFDSAEMPAFRLMMTLLNDRVFTEVRTKANLSYAPGAGVNLSAAPYGHIFFSTGNVNEAARLCLAEVARLKREPVTPDDLKVLCAIMRTNQYTNAQTNAAQAGELAFYDLIGGGWRNSLAPAYNAVTPADIQRVAQKWLNHGQFVLLGPAAAVIDKQAFAEPAGK